jgi:voltage-gated potassium channel
MLASVTAVYEKYQKLIQILEWIITVIFSVEYILRIAIAKRPFRYIFSFYGIVDFLAVIPTYMGLFFVGSHSFVVIRLLRLLRIFRILKLTRYTQAGGIIVRAMWASRQKILVFILFIVIIAVIMGTIVYLVEGEASGFTSIPISVYWAIVTLTTVGYGDISPITPLGRFIASIIMIMGYAIIAVPTGIVTAEMIKATGPKNTYACPQCLFDKHDDDAVFCKRCGVKIN